MFIYFASFNDFLQQYRIYSIDRPPSNKHAPWKPKKLITAHPRISAHSESPKTS